MTNIRLELEQYADLEIHNFYRERREQGYSHESAMESIYQRGRDNARTPMQWTAGENAGFTTATPWLPVNPNYCQINAAAELNDPDSVFYYYQKLIRLRKTYPIFREGAFNLLDPENDKIFAYTRSTPEDHLLVVCNFTAQAQEFALPERFLGAQKLIGNYPDQDRQLRPYEAAIYYCAE